MQLLTGSELRSRRIRLGLSREQIAHAVGVPLVTVTEWEEHDAAPIGCPNAVEQVLRRGENEVRARLPHAS